MPIKIPENLPAYDVLTHEGVMVMSENQASRQDIRPLRIALLNLMPRKIQTEIQFSRLIGATPLQIELTLIRMSDHQSKTTAAEHMTSFYRPFNEVAESGEKFDGLIITGAPIEHLPFEEVTYWEELRQIMDWTQTHVHSTLACAGAVWR
jgi:homoserine O-succinyltransferase